jgi:hypothetical protein
MNGFKIQIRRPNTSQEQGNHFIKVMYGLPTRPPAEKDVQMANGY